MSEESPENYNNGDIVWVKLGLSWWPGEVKDIEELPNEILDFKKPPLVIVKFFDEDSYEYVKSWSNIYPYNSEKKNEFIKKGMAAFRAKVSHMEKFPKDVITAETKMGGNLNILSDPMFLPEKKKNYVAEIFGTPSPKNKGNKEKKRTSTGKSSSQKDTAHITHRRFLGLDDYQAIICIQYPGKDRIPGDKEDEEVLRINREPEQEFNCNKCSFTTKRLEVMILHTKSHIQGVYVSSPRKTKHPIARRKKDKSKKSRGSDDAMDSDSSSSDSDFVSEKKRKPKPQGVKRGRPRKQEKPKEEPKTSSDIRSELLAVWGDSDEDEDFSMTLNKSTENEQSLSQSINDIILGKTPSIEAGKDPEEGPSKLEESELPDKTRDGSKKINDSILGESDDIILDATAEGDSSQLEITEDLTNSLESSRNKAEDEVDRSSEETDKPETENQKEPPRDSSDKISVKDDASDEEIAKEEQDTSKQGMDKDIQEAIKSCFDFEEDDEDDSALLGKTAAGRKIPRVIPPADRRKSPETLPEDELNRERILKESEDLNRRTERSDDVDATFKELMEMTSVPELPDIQNTLKCEQNFHNIKTIKFPDKPDAIGPSKVEKKEPSDAATKLINPKKRFVKSFEDFELMQNEIRRREEEAELKSDAKREPSPEATRAALPDYSTEDDNSDMDMSKLKSKIMSKIIEEAKINEECKTKIMSKMQESSKTKPDDSGSPEEVKPEKASLTHRTPRSKILELYRNDANKQKSEEEQKVEKTDADQADIGDTLRQALSCKEAVPPKKSKWSRRGSHPKKDRNAFLLEDVPLKKLESEESVEDPAKILSQTPPELPLPPTDVLSNNNDGIVEEKSINAPCEVSPKELIEEEDNSKDVLLPVEEESIKIPPVDDGGNKATEEPALIESAQETIPTVEERSELPSVTESLDIPEKAGMEKIQEKENSIGDVPTDLPVNEEIESQVSLPHEAELELPRKEAESNDTIEEGTLSVPLATEENLEAEKVISDSAIDKTEDAELLMDSQLQKTSDSSDDFAVDSVPMSPNRAILTADGNSTRADAVTETGNSNFEVEEAQPVPLEEIPLPSPMRDVFAAIDNTAPVSPKAQVCSPPKKAKKRKMSENLLAVSTDLPKDDHDLDLENFSPVEKKKKETDADETEAKEPSPIPERPETEAKEPSPNPERPETEAKEALPIPERPEAEAKEALPIPERPEAEAKEALPIPERPETEAKEPLPVPERPEMEMIASESEDNFREHKAGVNDMGVANTEAATPKLAEDKKTEHTNELEIQCGSSSPESFKFSIQTNLSNLTSREEISALALATLSEIKADLESSNSSVSEQERPEEASPSVAAPPPVPEMVPIEGNLTVVSERDLADGQVEITSEQVISPKKPVTLSTFSMDFSDSASDSNSTGDTSSDFGKCTEFSGRGIDFSTKTVARQSKRMERKRENTYERLDLLNILEGNSDTEKKQKEARSVPAKKALVDDICDFEEHIPSQIVCATKLKRDGSMDREYPYVDKVKTGEKSTASKLLERLTVSATKIEPKEPSKVAIKTTAPSTIKVNRLAGKQKSAATNKPIILSEQIVKPATTETSKAKTKKLLNDIEDVEAFVIHKDPKRLQEHESLDGTQATKSAGKAKILQQTIITPAGEIIQPTVSQAQSDDNIFDINSMPIVLSDEILTPESIEKMPIMIGSETKVSEPERPQKRLLHNQIIAKTTVAASQPTTSKNPAVGKQSKTPRILQSVGSKVIKNSPLLPNTTKPGKYIILPQSGVQAAKYAVKKGPIIKRTSIIPKSPSVAPEPSGNKIMIVTNQQGQQQRLLLTPAQQKMLGYQNQKAKTIVKGNVVQKSVLAAKSISPLVEAGTSGAISKSLVGQKVMMGGSPGAGLLATTASQVLTNQGRIIKSVTKKLHPVNQKVVSGATKTQKTILIKNQHGQTVRKIQGTDDELLDKQVAEQLEAIKASSGIKFGSQPKQVEPFKPAAKTQVRRSYSKKAEPKPKVGPPPLSGIQQTPKPEIPMTLVRVPAAKKPEPIESKPVTTFVAEEPKPPQDRPLNQLVIQDAVGNQTTITEGQILALPSETVDGQPQSYMLVTLDESGNLTPLNSEALMSLDPNLGLGGDLSNMVLQIDQGALADRPQSLAVKATVGSEPPKLVEMEPVPLAPVPEPSVTTEIADAAMDQKIVAIAEPMQPVPQSSTNGDPGQQLIVTGDPIATQKFLESLTEGTTDLANILANAEGNSILIQADGQQILINTNSDNQMLLSVNNDSLNVSESTEGGGNPIFATQPSKNQDILAAALADTDVFQQEQHAAQGKITSQLSPNNTLYPMNVSNVLETSLTLSSPIMTPLEVPSTNNKKIPDDEADILTQVPKNVDLPITITDPNISQTVANQQVASLIASELQTNLELALPVSETTISSVSTEMNSPSYVYSLPTLDESVDINQKPFNSSMPLLNEDIEEAATKPKVNETHKTSAEKSPLIDDGVAEKNQDGITSANSFLEEEEGRFTLGGEMCSSLSEPPPEMFDLPEENQNLLSKRNSNIPSSLQSTPEVSDTTSKDGDLTDMSPRTESSSEGSCEIPLQPQIVAKSLDLSENLGSMKRSLHESDDEESKRCKFD